MSIPGLPGASDPSFRTHCCHWMSLDTLVHEVCKQLQGKDGVEFNAFSVKVTIQQARRVLARIEQVDEAQLVASVTQHLRAERVLLQPSQVRTILTQYGRLWKELEIAEVLEQGR